MTIREEQLRRKGYQLDVYDFQKRNHGAASTEEIAGRDIPPAIQNAMQVRTEDASGGAKPMKQSLDVDRENMPVPEDLMDALPPAMKDMSENEEDQYETFLKNTPNPYNDRYKFLAAKAIHDSNPGISFGYALTHLDDLSMEQIGQKYSSTEGWFGSLVNSLRIGKGSVKVMDLQVAWQKAMQKDDEATANRIAIEIERLDNALAAAKEGDIPRNLILDWMNAGLQQVPYNMSGGKRGLSRAIRSPLLMGMGGATVMPAAGIATAVAGALSGASATPLAPVAAPTLGAFSIATLGFAAKYGSDIQYAEWFQASQIWDIMHMQEEDEFGNPLFDLNGAGDPVYSKVKFNVAQAASVLPSTLNALIEGELINLPLSIVIPGGALNSFVKSFSLKLAAKGVINRLAYGAILYGLDTLGEGGQEFFESLTDYSARIGARLASGMDMRVDQDSFGTALKSAMGDFVEGLKSASFTGLLTGGAGYAVTSKNVSSLKFAAQESRTETELRGYMDTIIGDLVPDSTKDELAKQLFDRFGGQGKIDWSIAKGGFEENGRASSTQGSLKEAVTSQSPVPVKEEKIQTPEGKVLSEAVSTARMETDPRASSSLEFARNETGGYDYEDNAVKKNKDGSESHSLFVGLKGKESGDELETVYGHIDYKVDKDSVVISGENRLSSALHQANLGEELAEPLVNKLREMYPKKTVRWDVNGNMLDDIRTADTQIASSLGLISQQEIKQEEPTQAVEQKQAEPVAQEVQTPETATEPVPVQEASHQETAQIKNVQAPAPEAVVASPVQQKQKATPVAPAKQEAQKAQPVKEAKAPAQRLDKVESRILKSFPKLDKANANVFAFLLRRMAYAANTDVNTMLDSFIAYSPEADQMLKVRDKKLYDDIKPHTMGVTKQFPHLSPNEKQGVTEIRTAMRKQGFTQDQVNAIKHRVPAVVYAAENADFRTFAHELFHLARVFSATGTGESGVVKGFINFDQLNKALIADCDNGNIKKFLTQNPYAKGLGFYGTIKDYDLRLVSSSDKYVAHVREVAQNAKKNTLDVPTEELLARMFEAYLAERSKGSMSSFSQAVQEVFRKIYLLAQNILNAVRGGDIGLSKDMQEVFDKYFEGDLDDRGFSKEEAKAEGERLAKKREDMARRRKEAKEPALSKEPEQKPEPPKPEQEKPPVSEKDKKDSQKLSKAQIEAVVTADGYMNKIASSVASLFENGYLWDELEGEGKLPINDLSIHTIKMMNTLFDLASIKADIKEATGATLDPIRVSEYSKDGSKGIKINIIGLTSPKKLPGQLAEIDVWIDTNTETNPDLDAKYKVTLNGDLAGSLAKYMYPADEIDQSANIFVSSSTMLRNVVKESGEEAGKAFLAKQMEKNGIDVDPDLFTILSDNSNSQFFSFLADKEIGLTDKELNKILTAPDQLSWDEDSDEIHADYADAKGRQPQPSELYSVTEDDAYSSVAGDVDVESKQEAEKPSEAKTEEEVSESEQATPADDEKTSSEKVAESFSALGKEGEEIQKDIESGDAKVIDKRVENLDSEAKDAKSVINTGASTVIAIERYKQDVRRTLAHIQNIINRMAKDGKKDNIGTFAEEVNRRIGDLSRRRGVLQSEVNEYRKAVTRLRKYKREVYGRLLASITPGEETFDFRLSESSDFNDLVAVYREFSNLEKHADRDSKALNEEVNGIRNIMSHERRLIRAVLHDKYVRNVKDTLKKILKRPGGDIAVRYRAVINTLLSLFDPSVRQYAWDIRVGKEGFRTKTDALTSINSILGTTEYETDAKGNPVPLVDDKGNNVYDKNGKLVFKTKLNDKALALEAMLGEDLMNRLVDTAKTPLDQWSLSDLDLLHDAVSMLRKAGRAAQRAERMSTQIQASLVVGDIRKQGERYRGKVDMSDPEWAKKHPLRNMYNQAFNESVNIFRVVNRLESDSKGALHKILVSDVIKNRGDEKRIIDQATDRFNAEIKAQKIKKMGFVESNVISFGDHELSTGIKSDARQTITLTTDQLLSFVMSQFDEYSRRAFAFGPEILSDQEKSDMSDKDMYGRNTFTSDERSQARKADLEKIGMDRYGDIVRYANKKLLGVDSGPTTDISILHESSTKWGAVLRVVEDHFKEMGHQVRDVAEKHFNVDMVVVEHYLPIFRLYGFDSPMARTESMLESLLDQNGDMSGHEIMNGFLQTRHTLSVLEQRDIVTNLSAIFTKSVKEEAHLIAFGGWAKKANALSIGGMKNEFHEALRKYVGENDYKYITSYISEVINPNRIAAESPKSSLGLLLRGNVAAGYLAGRTSSWVAQALTSFQGFIPEVGIASLARSAFDLNQDTHSYSFKDARGNIVHRENVSGWQMVKELSPVMKDRSFSTAFANWRAVREAERYGAGRTDTEVGKALAVGRGALSNTTSALMAPLSFIDSAEVYTGWRAILDKYLNDLQLHPDKYGFSNGDDLTLNNVDVVETLVRIADEETLRVQPSGDRLFESPLYKRHGDLAQTILQFTEPLNIVYQNLFVDCPMYLRNAFDKELDIKARQTYAMKGIMTIVSYMLAGTLLCGLRSAADPDDDEDDIAARVVYWMLSQGFESLPLIGDEVDKLMYSVITGASYSPFYSSSFPMVDDILKTVHAVSKGDLGKAAQKFTDALMFGIGGPKSMLDHIIKVVNGGETLGEALVGNAR